MGVDLICSMGTSPENFARDNFVSIRKWTNDDLEFPF